MRSERGRMFLAEGTPLAKTQSWGQQPVCEGQGAFCFCGMKDLQGAVVEKGGLRPDHRGSW